MIDDIIFISKNAERGTSSVQVPREYSIIYLYDGKIYRKPERYK